MNTDAVSDPRVCEFPESDEDPVTKLPSTAASARTFPAQQDLARSEAPFINIPIGTQGTFPPQTPRRFPQVIHTLLTCLCMTVH